jgi:catechol 2,3-dioxygenase-like lactoylglutathione lyase family enzyme
MVYSLSHVRITRPNPTRCSASRVPTCARRDRFAAPGSAHPVTAPRFNHVAVTCTDLDSSLAFYRDLVGLAVLDQGELSSRELNAVIGLGEVRLRFAELDLCGQGFLELLQYRQPRGEPKSSRTCDPGNVHFALVVAEIDTVHRRLVGAGVTTRSAPVTIARGEWRGARVFYALDPDGVTVEFIELPNQDRG